MSDDEEIRNEKKHIDTDTLVIQNIMQTEDGREYMWKKLQSASVFETIFDNDPIRHAFKAGVRDVGVQLNRDLKEYAPGDYIKMLKENM